jgi:hypothetical protein
MALMSENAPIQKTTEHEKVRAAATDAKDQLGSIGLYNDVERGVAG